MTKDNDDVIIAVANSYISKYYLDSRLQTLPVEVKNTLRVNLVSLTEENGGVVEAIFNNKNVSIYFKSYCKDTDFLYDEIGINLKIKKMIKDNKELISKIALFCKIKFNNENLK